MIKLVSGQSPRLVVIGNGMAGVRAVEEILTRAPGRFDITVFGAEPHGNYNRIMLSPVLAGEAALADIVTHDAAWYAANGVELLAGEAVVGIDRATRRVRGAHGTVRDYDVLLLATGSSPVMLPIPGADLPGVSGFRSIADVMAMRAACRPGGYAVVIGGGLLGLEAAYGLRRNGMAVTVLHLPPNLMERQLDAVSAGLVARALEARGISVITAARTRAVLGEAAVRAVALADGREIAADLVVMAAGVRPNIALAHAAGLPCGRGVLVDDTMRSDDPHVFAIGECAEYHGQVVGLVAPVWDMARVCAEQIVGTLRFADGAPIAGMACAAGDGSAAGTRAAVTGPDSADGEAAVAGQGAAANEAALAATPPDAGGVPGADDEAPVVEAPAAGRASSNAAGGAARPPAAGQASAGAVTPIIGAASANSTTPARYAPGIAGTHLKVTGIDTFSAGDFLGDATTEAIVFRDLSRGVHRRLVLRGDRLVGIAMVGDARDAGWFFDLLRRGADLAAIRDRLIFGPATIGPADTAASAPPAPRLPVAA